MTTNVTERKFDTGRHRFRFTDTDGEVFASFVIDPTDAGLLSRAEEIAAFFENYKPEARAGVSALSELSTLLTDKLSYLFGYDVSEELFGQVSPVTVSPDGEMFAFAVLDAVAEMIAPELKRRGEALRSRVGSYTDKYKKLS